MKKRILLSGLLLILFAACQKELPEQSRVIVEPERPQWNKTVTISYTPGTQSPLAGSDSVWLQALFVPVNPTEREILEKGRMNEITMQKEDETWQARLNPDETVGCIVFRFKSGEKYDNHNGKGWDVLLYTGDGKPVKGAWSALSQATGEGVVSFLLDLKKFNADTALAFYQKETELYPDNWRARAVGINLRYRTALKANDKQAIERLGREMETFLTEHPDDLTVLEIAYIFYYRPRPDKAEAILERIASLNPKHRYVLGRKINKIKAIKNVRQRMQKLAALEKDVEGTDSYFSWSGYMLQDLAALKKWNEVIALGQKAVQSLESRPLPYPSYTEKKALKRKQSRLYAPLMALAEAYHATGKDDKAEECYQKISKLNMYPHQEVAYLEDYIQFLLDKKRYDQAAEAAIEAIKKANASEKIEALFRKAYTEKTGDARAAENIIAEAKKESGAYRKKELAKTMITNPRPAPAFSLKTLDGKTVSLADLRGKTVIVDFWATWCSPCKVSFPYLQKFWQQHQNDPKVALFAVDTKERIKGQKRIDAIKKFMGDNGYTFTVLLDDEENSVMKAFEVGGIPTKFFIGPDGKIYFKEIGFHGPSMTEDMNIQLELIEERLRSLF